MDSIGNLYGNTVVGGPHGVVFELSPVTGKTKWNETVLYSFCQQTNCTDGIDPWGELVMDTSGSLLGVTGEGGAYGEGTIFKIIPNGTDSEHSVLYSFCSQANCTDGARPEAALLLDSSGHMYGTISEGGAGSSFDAGTVFMFDGSTLTTLHSFCTVGGCSDGASPVAPVIVDDSGNLLGVTLNSGAYHYGAAFELVP